MEGRIVIFITGNAKGTRVIVSVEQMCSCIQDFHTKFVDLPDLQGFASAKWPDLPASTCEFADANGRTGKRLFAFSCMRSEMAGQVSVYLRQLRDDHRKFHPHVPAA